MSRVAVLHTGQRLIFPNETTPEVMQAAVKKYLASQAAPEEPTDQRGMLSNVGTALQKGIVAIPQAAVGLADIVSGGEAGKYVQENVYDLAAKQEALSKEYSAAQQEDFRKVQEAKGFTGTLGALAEHPSVAAYGLVESLPQMAVMGGMGKGLQAAKILKGASALGAAEGTVMGGAAAEKMREESPDKLLSGKKAAAAVGTGVVGGLFGVLGNKVATHFGGTDIVGAMMGNARKAAIKTEGEIANTPGYFQRTMASAFGEGALEEMPQSATETMFDNYANDRPLFQGVPESAAQGLATGALGGAGISTLVGGEKPVVATPEAVKLEEVAIKEAPEVKTGSAAMAKARDLTQRAKAATEGILASEPPIAGAETATPVVPEAPITPAPEAVVTPEAPIVEPVIEEPVMRVKPEQETLLESWGLNKRQKAYKDLMKQDLSTPEGLAKADIIVQQNEDSVHPGNTFNKSFDRDAFETHAEAVRSKAEAVTEAPTAIPEAPITKTPEAAAVIPPTETAKQPWQMTRAELEAQSGEAYSVPEHHAAIKQALEQHKSVPADVYTEYKASEVKKPEAPSARPWTESVLEIPISANRLKTSPLLQGLVDEHPELAAKARSGKLNVGDIHDKLPEASKDAFVAAMGKAYKPATKEDEVDLFSVSTSNKTTGHSAESLLRSAPKDLKSLVASGKAVFHNNQSTLPPRADGLSHPANVKGMTTPDGVTHYVANKLTPSTLHGVALHEAGVHAGMEAMVGEKLWNDFKEQVSTSQDPAIVAAREAVPESTPDQHRAEEALAHLVEHSPNHSLVRRLIAAIRNWARKTFGVKMTLTEADARQLAVAAMRKEAKTAVKTATGKDERYGKGKDLLAPNGKPSNLNAVQHAQVRTAAFKKWFGDWENDPRNASKVVDENGEPMVVYHAGSWTDNPMPIFGTGSLGIHFGTKTAASDRGGSSLATTPAYLNIKSPFYTRDMGFTPSDTMAQDLGDVGILSKEQVKEAIDIYESQFGASGKKGLALKNKVETELLDLFKNAVESKGRDGIIYKNDIEDKGNYSYIALNPNQIKSAIGNTGAFSTETPDIRYAIHADPAVNDLLNPALRQTTEKEALSRLGAVNETIQETKALIPKGKKMFRTSWVASMDGLSKTLNAKPLFEAGKLRADQVMRFTKQLGSLIRAGLEYGVPVLAGDNTVKIKEDKRLALSEIMKRTVALGKDNKFDGMAVVNEVARALHGEETIEADKNSHRRAAALRTLAKQKFASAQIKGQSNAEIMRKYAQAKTLNRDASKLEEIRRERGNITPERIAAAHEMVKKYPEIETILKDIRDLNRALADYLKETGLIDQYTLDSYNKPKYYFPMYTSEDVISNEDGGIRWGSAGRGAKSTPQVQRRKGHEYKINMWDNLQKHYGFMTASGMQNYTRQTAVQHMAPYGEAKKAQDQGMISTDGNLAVYENGEKVWYVIDDGNTLLAFQNFHYVLNPIMQVMSKATAVLRAGALINPIYWYRQLVRDPTLAWLTGDVGLVTPFHALYEFAHMTTGTSKIGKKLRLRGVVGPVDTAHDYNDMQRQIGRALNQPKDIWSIVGDAAMHIHEASDSATRAAVYRSAYKIAKKEGMSDVDADNVATFKARETINFSVHGNSEALNTIRNLTPFFSATLNGLDVMYRAMVGHNLNPADRKRVMKKFYSRGIMLFSMSIIYALIMGNDESYKDVPDAVKDNNWLVAAGPDDEHGRHTFIKIPAPHDVGFMFKTLPELIIRMASKDVTFREVISSFFRATGQMLPPLPTVQALKPILETAWNHDSFSGRGIEGHFDAGKSVGNRDTNASWVAKFISNELGLKNINLSPVKIDHLLRGYFAEWGAIGTAVADAMIQKIKGENLTPTTSPLKYPMVRSLLTDPETSKNTTRFYDLFKAANMINNDLADAKRSGDREAAMKILADPENKKQIGAFKPLNNISDELSKLRAQIQVIGNRPSSPENIQRIREIKYRQTLLADRAVKLADRAGLKY